METENPQPQIPNIPNNIPHEMAVVLMQRDIQYMNLTLISIANELKAMEKNYATKTELHDIEKNITKQMDGIEKNINKETELINTALKSKVDQTEFKPIKSALTKINWLLISGVVLGVLNMILNTGTNGS